VTPAKMKYAECRKIRSAATLPTMSRIPACASPVRTSTGSSRVRASSLQEDQLPMDEPVLEADQYSLVNKFVPSQRYSLIPASGQSVKVLACSQTIPPVWLVTDCAARGFVPHQERPRLKFLCSNLGFIEINDADRTRKAISPIVSATYLTRSADRAVPQSASR
jgi:hypothetical protein